MSGPARTVRNAGYVACLLGVLIMAAGRYMASAPHVLMFVGLGVILVGWALMAFAVFARVASAKGHSPHGSR